MKASALSVLITLVAGLGCEVDRALGTHGARLRQAEKKSPRTLAAAGLPPCAAAPTAPLDWPRRELLALGVGLRLPPSFTRQRSPMDTHLDSVRSAVLDSIRRAYPERSATLLESRTPMMEYWMAPDSAMIMLIANSLDLAVGAEGAVTAEPACAVTFRGQRMRADPMLFVARDPGGRLLGESVRDTSFALVILPEPGAGGVLLGGGAFFYRRADREAFVAALADAVPLGTEPRQ